MSTVTLIRDPYSRLRNASGNSDTATRLFLPYTSLTDTYLLSSSPTNNYGSAVYIYCRTAYVTLLKFDLSGIPAGSTINSAQLRLYPNQNPNPDVTLAIHRILAANSAWTAALATWNTTNGVDAWAGSAGCGTSGVDYAADALWSDTADAVYGSWDLFDLDTTEFEAMLAANHGMVLFSSDADLRRWPSSDSAVSDYYKPCMLVTYTEP